MERYIFKCPFCDAKYMSLTKKEKIKAKHALYEHMDKEHFKELNNLSPAQVYFNTKYNKTHGTCVICGNKTKWNEHVERYDRFCSDKCKEKYVADFKKKMVDKYGKPHLLNDENQQKKMLANRKISGIYTWSDNKTKIEYTGSYEKDFLDFMDNVMNWDGKDIVSPCPITFKYTWDGKDHFYIPDFYIMSLNIIVEIKDGVTNKNKNKHPKIQAVDRAKELEKDKVMRTQNKYIYVKILNKEYENFVDIVNYIKSCQ